MNIFRSWVKENQTIQVIINLSDYRRSWNRWAAAQANLIDGIWFLVS